MHASFWIRISAFWVACLILAGCETTRSSQAVDDAQGQEKQSEFIQNYFSLKQGMSAEEITARFGDPERVESLVSNEVPTEVWHYTEIVESKTEANTQGTREEPYWDISENRMRTREVAIEGIERHEVIARLELLMLDGKLVSWKDEIDRRRIEY